MAHITGNTAQWDCGKTPEEAIGRLVNTFPKELGIKLDYKVKASFQKKQ
jgi:hypothetical protein